MKKKKMNKFLSMILVGFLSICIGFTETVDAAKLGESFFWGITANFESGSFEGVVVVDDNGKYDEAYHSLAHATHKHLQLENIRINSTDIKTINSWSGYYMHAAQGKKATQVKTVRDSTGSLVQQGAEYYTVTWAINGYAASNDWINNFKTSSLDKLQNTYMQWSGNLDSWEAEHALCKNWFSFNASKADGYDNQCDARANNSIYTWPGVTGAGDATAEDESMLNWVNATLVTEYNNVLAFLTNNANYYGIKLTTAEGKLQFLDFAVQVAHAAYVPGTYTINTPEMKIVYQTSRLSNAELAQLDRSEPGTLDDDFIKFTVLSTDSKKENASIIARYSVPKGYGEDDLSTSGINESQRLAGYLAGRGKTGLGHITSQLTWEHVVYQAMFNYYMTGQTSLSANEFYAGQAGFLEQQIVELFDSAVKSIQNMLGLYSFEELMLNQGSRGIRYWQGVVPSTWFTACQYFYLFTFSLSMLMLLISLVKLAFQKSASTIGNAARRVSLMEGIKKIIIASIAVILFQSIFYIIVQMNSSLIEAISGLVDGEVLFNSTSLSSGTLASVVLSVVFLYISIKLNISYMLRGITLLLCYLLGPICIICSTLGTKFSMITSNWVKELAGNLFIQAIHALILVLYISISRTGSNASIEKIVLVYSFVPLTEFIRTNIFALGKGLEDVASNMASGASKVGGAVAGLGLVAGKNLLKGTVAGTVAGVTTAKAFKDSEHSGGMGALNTGKAGDAVKTGQRVGTTPKVAKQPTSATGAGLQAFKSKFSEKTAGTGRALARGVYGLGQVTSGFAAGSMNAQGRSDMMLMNSGQRMIDSGLYGMGGGGFVNDIHDNIEANYLDDYQDNVSTSEGVTTYSDYNGNVGGIEYGSGLTDTKAIESVSPGNGNNELYFNMHVGKDTTGVSQNVQDNLNYLYNNKSDPRLMSAMSRVGVNTNSISKDESGRVRFRMSATSDGPRDNSIRVDKMGNNGARIYGPGAKDYSPANITNVRLGQINKAIENYKESKANYNATQDSRNIKR